MTSMGLGQRISSLTPNSGKGSGSNIMHNRGITQPIQLWKSICQGCLLSFYCLHKCNTMHFTNVTMGKKGKGKGKGKG